MEQQALKMWVNYHQIWKVADGCPTSASAYYPGTHSQSPPPVEKEFRTNSRLDETHMLLQSSGRQAGIKALLACLN